MKNTSDIDEVGSLFEGPQEDFSDSFDGVSAPDLWESGIPTAQDDGLRLPAPGSPPLPAPTIYIRTSERLLFRRCRRLWGWLSPLRMGLEVKVRPDYFWFGTGMHYALEDYHGVNTYGHPAKAFWAYYHACKESKQLPPTAADLICVGIGMMEYYADFWLAGKSRDPLKTLILPNGQPATEVRFEIPLPVKGPNGEDVVYRGTLDGLIEDEHNRVWIKEYKSAKAFRVYHFDTDDQITAYCWATKCILPDREVAGVCYQQHKKDFPNPPRILKTTGRVSTAEHQKTNYALYLATLIDIYGSWDCFPDDNKAYLNKLAADDTEDGDKYIQRDWITRNEHQLAAQGEKIMLELEDILNPNLPLYPNPSKDCSWQCPLEAVCVAMDDGSDWSSLLKALTTPKTGFEQQEQDKWRNHLPHPQNLPELPEEMQTRIRQLLEHNPELTETLLPDNKEEFVQWLEER